MLKRGVGLFVLVSAASLARATVPEVVIDPGGVPPAALKEIQQAVGAITRLAGDQDLSEVSRLRRRAHDATVSTLQTQGYFDSVVTLEVGEDFRGETWDIIIEPGEITTVRQADLRFVGQITQPEFKVRLEGLKADFPLREGDPFLNKRWSAAKSDLLEEVRRKDFYYARYTQTRAVVHADQAKADLSLHVRSGPRVRMGSLYTAGLKRVPLELIERYVTYEPGEPYDQDKLDEWQQALAATSFFRGAFVTLDDSSNDQVVRADGEVEIPVLVRVTEAPARQFTGSLGFDSDHGPRLEGLYKQNIVFGQPVWFETGAGVDANRQKFFYDLHFPPTSNAYRHSVGLLYEHTDIEGQDNTRAAVGWKLRHHRQSDTNKLVDYENEWGLLGAWDKTRLKGAETFEIPSAILSWNWLRRHINDKYDPRDGNVINTDLAAGLPLNGDKPFYRAGLRLQQWWPVNKWDVVSVRGEVGRVWSRSNRIPPDFGFRTGGSSTIRGYKYHSIGLHRGEATVGAPYLAVASIEYTRYFTEMFGMRAFIDVGDAADSFRDMKLAWGYGLGAAVRTPAGPFNVDLAWAQRDRKLRLSFSMGIAF